jgi:1,4-dihydroxy-2-naphthoate octaprenyltransferase
MSQFKSILHASRLRTLPLALSCIITGNAMAYYLGAFQWEIFFLSIVTTLLLQIVSNFSNDIGDSEKGTDNEDRIGPQRAIQSGVMTPDELKKILKITMLLALLSGIALILVANILWWEKLLHFLVGLIALWAADNYTKGDIAYGYRAYGDVFVFLFFGIIGVIGSMFLNVHQLNNAALLPAIGVGCLTTSVLHLNNLRDMMNDAKSGKITVAIQFGYENSRIYFIVLILIGMLSWGSYVFTQNLTNWYSYTYWLGFVPFMLILIKFLKIKELKDFDMLLKPTALATFFLSILFFISQVL